MLGNSLWEPKTANFWVGPAKKSGKKLKIAVFSLSGQLLSRYIVHLRLKNTPGSIFEVPGIQNPAKKLILRVFSARAPLNYSNRFARPHQPFSQLGTRSARPRQIMCMKGGMDCCCAVLWFCFCDVLCCGCFAVACWCRNPFNSGSKSTKNRSKIDQVGARGYPQEVKKRENQKMRGSL